MAGNFSIESKALAWQDVAAQQNPRQLVFSWAKTQVALPFDTAASRSLLVSAGATSDLPVETPLAVVPVGPVTSFTVTAGYKANIYRFTVNAGTLIATNILSGATNVTFATRTDGKATITLSAANVTVTANGRIFIPGVATGDVAGPFSNYGNWRVASVSSDGLTVIATPLDGQAIVTETVSATGSQFQTYAPGGADLGWKVYSKVQDWFGVFEVTSLTSTWFEVSRPTTFSLPLALPGSANTYNSTEPLWYWASAFPQFVRIEAFGTVQITGLTSTLTPYTIIPFNTAQDNSGWVEFAGGAVLSPLQVKNIGAVPVAVNVFVVY
jgi:hypothetical protein